MGLNILLFACACLFVSAYAANDPFASLLFCDGKNIVSYNLTTKTEKVVLSGLKDATAIDYHFEKQYVFWSDITEKKIYRALLLPNGTLQTPTAVLESVVSYGVAVDWYHDLLYWTNSQAGSVEVAKLDGSERRTIVGAEDGAKLWSIVVHPMQGLIFWTDRGRNNRKILRSNVDGTNRRQLILSDVINPHSLAIDLNNQSIFWISHNIMHTAKLDGTYQTVKHIIYSADHLYSLDVDQKYVYFAYNDAMYQLKGPKDLTNIYTHNRRAKGMKVFSCLKQPIDVTMDMCANVTAEKHQCVRWFFETRSKGSVNKWGPQLPRTAVALYLSDPGFFAPENRTGQEMRYELAIQLLSTLNRHEILRTEKLTMYVHALVVSCLNPYNFYGHDLVSELRKRVDGSKYVNPLAILALCNAGAQMNHQDVQRLNETYTSQHVNYWTDVQVICTMALSCISSKTNVSVDQEVLQQWVNTAKNYTLQTGADELNPRTVALILQLMLSTNYSRGFYWPTAVRAILNPTFVNSSNLLDKYYLTPVLSNKGLNDIDNKHCPPYLGNDLQPNSDSDLITVRYTVRAENDISLAKTWRIKMPNSSTLYDVMMTVQTLDTDHTVKFNMVKGKPFVGSVSDLAEDPEYDNYWFTYVRTQESVSDLRLLVESPRDVIVANEDEYIIWYRSAIWKSDSNGSGEHSSTPNKIYMS